EKGGVSVKPDPNAENKSETKINYTDENGKPQEVTYTKDSDGKWHKQDPENKHPNLPETSNDKGEIKIPGTEIKDNTEVSATTTDPSKNESGEGKITAGDSTAPETPKVTADTEKGGVSVKPDPNAENKSETKINYTDENGKPQEVTYTKDSDGK
ncbi:hypothetical protein, partial [Campylobacter concisus]|uniref:hypothetical protein n=1 Tax=Campylobacter concisus TaxID=199 RepID=UPI001CA5143B